MKGLTIIGLIMTIGVGISCIAVNASTNEIVVHYSTLTIESTTSRANIFTFRIDTSKI